MKKWFLILFTGMAATTFSQGSDQVRKDTVARRGLRGPATLSTRDTVVPRLWDKLQQQPIPDYGMPNAITNANRPAPDVYVGNNGKGQDIYRSQLDNMPILKPDSSFSSNMDALKPVPKKRGMIYRKPYLQPAPQIRVLPKSPKFPAPKKQ